MRSNLESWFEFENERFMKKKGIMKHIRTSTTKNIMYRNKIQYFIRFSSFILLLIINSSASRLYAFRVKDSFFFFFEFYFWNGFDGYMSLCHSERILNSSWWYRFSVSNSIDRYIFYYFCFIWLFGFRLSLNVNAHMHRSIKTHNIFHFQPTTNATNYEHRTHI